MLLLKRRIVGHASTEVKAKIDMAAGASLEAVSKWNDNMQAVCETSDFLKGALQIRSSYA
jgi:hypothetical protein